VLRSLLVALGAWSAMGCASSQVGTSGAPVLFPPLPNRPRIQFLAAYEKASDIEESSAFADFVLGGEKKDRGLTKPYSAVRLDNRLIVTDVSASEIVVFDFAARQFRPLKGNTGGGRVRRPMNLGVSADGALFVSDTDRNQVLAFGPDESFLKAYGEEGEIRPAGVAASATEVFVCDVAHHQIAVFDRVTGQLVRRLGTAGREPGQLYYPTNLAMGPEGDLYVSETGNFRVQRMTPQGVSVRTFGRLGKTPGTFSRPKGVAVDPLGRVFAVDTAFENVQVFDPEGRLLMFFGGPGHNAGDLGLPAGISIGTGGVAEYRDLADPNLELTFLVTVVSQYGERLVNVFGFGEWKGPEKDPEPGAAAAETAYPTSATPDDGVAPADPAAGVKSPE
jgi:sugar lactone lactonase YvrE